MEITKTDFEAALPVGTSSHEEVFESVKPAIDEQMMIADNEILGDAGMALVKGSAQLQTFYKKYVCLAGFLSVMRQLDLVLTPTGFGIVSNDTISPASKQRVDSLEGSLRTQLLKAHAMLLYLLRSEEWGGTSQAERQMPYVYDEYTFIFAGGKTHPIAYDDWYKFQRVVADADDILRRHISDSQMDEFLDAMRKNDDERMRKYGSVMHEICRFTDAMAGGFKNAQTAYRKIINIIEKEPEVFERYMSSDAYKLNHHETFQNTKESSAFVFNG